MADETALECELSEPTPDLIEAMRRIEGDIVILGAGGKMGPTLAQLAVRASDASGNRRQIVAVARFSDPGARLAIEAAGARCIRADLLDTDLNGLPDAPNVIFMAGQKFGTTGDTARTWAVNALLPGLVVTRYRGARLVVFSTGNVYPFWPLESEGPTESDPVGPVGEYAQSALARERIFEYAGERHGTRSAILRINYAIEPRYGVLPGHCRSGPSPGTDQPRHGSRQRDLAAGRQCHRASGARVCGGTAVRHQRHRTTGPVGSLAGGALRRPVGR